MLAFKNNLTQMCETCQVQALLAPPPLLITSCTHSVTHSGARTLSIIAILPAASQIGQQLRFL